MNLIWHIYECDTMSFTPNLSSWAGIKPTKIRLHHQRHRLDLILPYLKCIALVKEEPLQVNKIFSVSVFAHI